MAGAVETATRKSLAETIPEEPRRWLLDRRQQLAHYKRLTHWLMHHV